MTWFNKTPRQPAWAKELLAQNQQILEGITKLMSEDAAIEAEVSILVTDAANLGTAQTALASAFAALEAEVAAGQPLQPQTLTDLSNAVAGIGTAVTAVAATVPAAPAPTPDPSGS